MCQARKLGNMSELMLALILGFLHGASPLKHLQVIHEWKSVDFHFPRPQDRAESIGRGDFVPGNAVTMDVDVWMNGRERTVFVTLPKFKRGIPASLATVSGYAANDTGNPLLSPYPDWAWHSKGRCDGITSAFRTQIDKCGRLWVVDSGMVDLSLGTSRRLCQPQLVAFSLESRRPACVHKFPDALLNENSILVNLAVDVASNTDNCLDTFVYVADVTAYRLIVFNLRSKQAWKIQSNTMYPYPPYGVFRANNAEFDLMDGILGLALTPERRGERTLYYHSLASVRESWVPTSALKAKSNFLDNENKVPRQFHMSSEARKSQSIAEAFDRSGTLYFGMMDDNSLNCWNSENSFKSSNIHQLERDDSRLQFASGLKVIPNENDEEEIWIMTNRFQLVMTGGMNGNEVNFRILKGKLNELTRNSQCRTHKAITFPNATHTYASYTEKFSTKPSYYGYGR